jgi:hypothetical protein
MMFVNGVHSTSLPVDPQFTNSKSDRAPLRAGGPYGFRFRYWHFSLQHCPRQSGSPQEASVARQGDRAVSELVSRKPFPKPPGPKVVGPSSWRLAADFHSRDSLVSYWEKGVTDGKEEEVEGGLDLGT